MKIVHLIKTSEGAAWAIDLIEDLSEMRPDLNVVVVIPKGGKYFARYLKACQSVYAFDFSLGFNFFSKGKDLKKIITNEKPDVIHSWFTQTTFFARIFLRNNNIPRVFQVAGPLHLESKIFKWADVRSANELDFWIGTSKYICDKYLSSGVARNRVFLNYAYINLEKLDRASHVATPVDYMEKYTLPKGSKIIGTASYFYPPKFYAKFGVKGHEHLFKLFEELIKIRDDLYLVIAGTTFGPDIAYEKKLKSQAEKLFGSRVIFTGGYTNIFEVIAHMDVFVYLSRSENLGGVYESLYFKMPTLSSDRGGLTELVVDGETGYTTKLNEIKSGCEKVIDLLSKNDKVEHFKNSGHQKVKDIFNQKLILNKTLDIYDQVLKDV